MDELTSVCLVIGLSFRKRGLSMISHTCRKRRTESVHEMRKGRSINNKTCYLSAV